MPKVEQGGAVAVRTDYDRPRYLVVTARTNDEHWVLPKSELEEGEGLEDAAIRELLACGVQGEFSGRIGTTHFESGDREVDVTYFLIHLVSDVVSTTGRQTEWLEYEQAREKLTFEDTKEILDKASSYLTTR